MRFPVSFLFLKMSAKGSRFSMERPKLGEDEDELLKFQQEFLASKDRPAATVVRKTEKRKSGETGRDVVHMDDLPSSVPALNPQSAKKSRFRAEREQEGATHSGKTSHLDMGQKGIPELDTEEMLDKQDRGFAAVVSSIIERDTRNAAFNMPVQSRQAFPSVVKNSVFAKDGGQKRSLFAQQIAQQGVQEFGVMIQQEIEKMDVTDPCSSSTKSPQLSDISHKALTRSHIVDGRGLSVSQAEEEAERIHKENLAKMEEMSEVEILEEQKQLLRLLDPSVVAFLRSKSQTSNTARDQSKLKAPRKASTTAQPAKKETASDLPEAVPMESSKKWVHMDKVEYDKLEWMKDLPPPSADDTKTGQQARFDFQGNLVPVDADVPVTSGLHHHGEEPERAGYSVAELFQLARSTNIQQRVLALTTLANVIHKAKDGSLDELIQTPLLPSIMDGGIIFLLRWACDDSVDAVVASALSALCGLLCNPADEAALDRVSSWYHGLVRSSLVPAATVQVIEQNKMEQDEDNKVEEEDAEVAKRDLIQALVSRMMLLERLYYILDSRKPQAPTVVSILTILTRVARHSMQMAYEIARHTKLMNLIFQQFLPITWTSQDDQKAVSSVYGRPLAAAMRLVGSLCQAGRHIAATIASGHSLPNILVSYLAIKAEGLQLSAVEAESLQKESLITWKSLLPYGLAADVFLTIYESLMDQLKDIISQLSDVNQTPAPRDVYFMSVLEGILPVAAMSHVKSSFNLSDSGVSETAVNSMVNWSHVEGLFPLVRMSAERSLAHLAEHYTTQKPSLQFPAVCLNFLATYHNKWEGQPNMDAVTFLQQLEQFCTSTLIPFLKSWGFTSMLTSLGTSSNILSSSEFRRREVCKCLPELGCDGQELRVPIVGGSSPMGFLVGLTRLVYTMCRIHKDMIEKTAAVILGHSDIISYLRKVTTCPPNHLHHNHFTRLENLLHYFLIKLSVMVTSSQRPPMMHQLTLDVMSRLQDGDECLAHDLLSSVLFNADFIPEGQDDQVIAASVADMKLSSTHFLKSATQEEINTNNSHLLREGFKSLPVIRSHYFKAFAFMEEKVALSRCFYMQSPKDTNSLMAGRCDSCLMPQDWVFLPLVELYNMSALVESKAQNTVVSTSCPMVTNVLQWIFMLETWRNRSLSNVSVTLKISRIMCVFLAGNDLFLERTVYPYLASLFRVYTTPRLLNAMNFEEHVPGISSFYDLYMQFLDQFEAVSFGDTLFGAYVLLPMQQCQSSLLRRAVWQERSNLFRSLKLPVTEMLIDIEQFLHPDETDIQLLQLYSRGLLLGAVRQCWSPVLFLVALHHLNHFLFYTQDEANNNFRQSLWSSVLQCHDKGLTETIIHFKQVNTQTPSSMELYPQLPANRMAVLNQHKSRLGLQ